MKKTQETQFIVAETFRSERSEAQREDLQRIVDDYLYLKLKA